MQLEKVERNIFFKVSRNLTFLGGALVVMFLTSCSSKPSVKAAERVIVRQYKNDKYDKIIDIQKVNGWENDVMGQKVYTMQCKITFEYLVDLCVYSMYFSGVKS